MLNENTPPAKLQIIREYYTWNISTNFKKAKLRMRLTDLVNKIKYKLISDKCLIGNT